MKEIFDWMRGQMLKRKSAWEEESVADKISAEKHIGTWNVALRILDTAEAKWKEDCCEWKLEDEEANLYVTKCEQRQLIFDGTPTDNDYMFCPYCGKRIKISEVE